MVDYGSKSMFVGRRIKDYRCLKPYIAKEDRNKSHCLGKPLDCGKAYIQGIAMWTKWQSGPALGDNAECS